MVKSGMHFGHRSRKWNPKMKPFIYTQKNHLHLIDLVKTHRHLSRVLQYLTKVSSEGRSVLFVSTKKQSSYLISNAARSCRSFYVNEKWLGGMLTNWTTVKSSTKMLRKLEAQEKSGFLRRIPKKEMAVRLRKKQKLQRTLGGLKYMRRPPGVIIIIGQIEEIKAVHECNQLGIRSITSLDTNNDPSLADLFIPVNDDSLESIELLLNQFVTAICDGQSTYNVNIKPIVERRIFKSSQRRNPKKSNNHKS